MSILGRCKTNNSPKAISPNPNHYKVKYIHHFHKAFILQINYTHCTNYEGNKIILYLGKCDPFMLKAPIDPHFREEKGQFPKPFARFEPTKKGLQAALHMAELISLGLDL